jgi:uncharacterized protein YlxW (UPF0749 family)
MGLLEDVISKALDPGYAEAAARGPVRRSTPKRLGHGGFDLLLAVLLGLVTVVAVTQLRSPSLSGPDPRELLEREITDRTAEADALASDAQVLSAEIAQIQTDAVASVNPGLFAQLEDYELASGAVGVTGAGLVMVVDDSDVDPDDDAAHVQDVDLQVVTNGLWAAGAEAIAINGQRLTSLSAIRSAGQAILVDLNPLIPPYRIEVIGDAHELQTTFARSSAANHLAFLSGTYGITVETTSQTALELPGVGNRTLRYAVPSGMASSSTEDDKKGTP